MKKIISLDEQLQIIAKRNAMICVGKPTNEPTIDFNFEPKSIIPKIEKSNITTVNPIG